MSHYSKILFAVQIFLDKKWDFRTVWSKGEEVFQDLKNYNAKQDCHFLNENIYYTWSLLPNSPIKILMMIVQQNFWYMKYPTLLRSQELKIKTFLRGSQNLFYDKALIIIANLYTFVILLYDIKNAVFVFLSVPQISHA